MGPKGIEIGLSYIGVCIKIILAIIEMSRDKLFDVGNAHISFMS